MNNVCQTSPTIWLRLSDSFWDLTRRLLFEKVKEKKTALCFKLEIWIDQSFAEVNPNDLTKTRKNISTPNICILGIEGISYYTI